MNKEFIPYEQALELKQIGFDESCFAYYHEDGILINYPQMSKNKGLMTILNRCSAPLKSQAFRWFRENYNLFTTIKVDKTMEPKFCYSIDELQMFDFFGEWKNIVFNSDLYYTYEEAELDCLKKLIEIVKNK